MYLQVRCITLCIPNKVGSNMDIVKYDNEFNLTLNFNKLSQVEQDIFFAITSEITKTKKTQLKLTANYIRQKINLQNIYRPSEVTTFLKTLSVKLSEIPFIVENEGEFIVTPIFAKFRVDKTTQETDIILNDQFLTYFYDIPLSFTQFELIKFVNIKSKYAKTLFRYLLDLKHYAHERKDGVRIWRVDFDEFKKIMSFPKSYQTTSVIRNLNKSIEEINKTGYIISLSYERIYSVEKKGKPIKSLIFSYELAKSTSKSAYAEQFSENVDSEQKEKYFCPYCKKEVVRKNGKNGIFYGHKYYVKAECKHTWSSLEDLNHDIELVNTKENEKKEQKKAQESEMQILEQQRDELFANHNNEKNKKAQS